MLYLHICIFYILKFSLLYVSVERSNKTLKHIWHDYKLTTFQLSLEDIIILSSETIEWTDR